MRELFKKWITAIKKLPLNLIGCLLLVAVCALTFGILAKNPFQAVPASTLTASFSGEYKIGDGEWQTVQEGEHISSTQGDVTLRGKFIVSFPNGEYLTDNPEGLYLNFYCNHIAVQVRVGDETVPFDAEFGPVGANACRFARVRL